MPEPEPDMKTASRMGSSTEPVRIEMPPKFGQRMGAEEGWLAAENENNVIRRFYMGDRFHSIEKIVDKYCERTDWCLVALCQGQEP